MAVISNCRSHVEDALCCASNVYGVHSCQGFDSLPSYKSKMYCCPAPLRSLFPCSWLILFGIHFERVPFLLKQAVQHVLFCRLLFLCISFTTFPTTSLYTLQFWHACFLFQPTLGMPCLFVFVTSAIVFLEILPLI